MHEKVGTKNVQDKLTGFSLLTIVTITSEKKPFHEKIEPQDNYRVLSCAYWRKVLQKDWNFLCIKIEQKYLNHNGIFTQP